MIVWLVSYPRSGNTFARVVLHHAFGMDTYSIHGDTADIASDPDTSAMVGHKPLPEDFDYAEARASSECFVIKTHEPYRRWYGGDKVLYLIRDGREATVSYYHYLRTFTQESLSILEIINGFALGGAWGSHYLGWKRAKGQDMQVLSFEESIADPDAMIDQIASFTGLRPVGRRVPAFSELHGVNPRFFRKGATDSFSRDLSEHEHKYFWMVNRRAMAEAGYLRNVPEIEPQERDELLFEHVDLSARRQEQQLTRVIRNNAQMILNKLKEQAG